jgi:Flp pilus assembly protein TadD
MLLHTPISAGRSIMEGKHDAAIAEERVALRLKPDDAVAHTNLGIALFEKGQYEVAIAESRKALRLKPDIGEAHANLGRALAAVGNRIEGLREIRRGYELDPKDEFVRKTYQLFINAAD